MPNLYPEHIDQLDDFYRSQLADCEIQPPDGLWDKISSGISQSAIVAQNTPPSTAANVATVSSMPTTTKVIVGTVVGGAIAIGIYFFLFRSSAPTDQKAVPVIEQPIQEQQPSGDASSDHKSISGDAIQKQPKSSSAVNKKQPEQSTEKKNTAPVIEEPAQIIPAIVEAPKEEQKTDSIAEIKTTQKAPKEKVKFKDKYKKEYQDSTRKIFVPSK